MSSWYHTFCNNPNIEIININNYIEILKKNVNLKNEDIIEHKLNQIENTYEIKLEELSKTSDDPNIINNYMKNNSLFILQKELDIIKLLTKYALQNNHLNYTFFYKSIKFLFKLSELLRIRLKQKEVIHDNKIIKSINLPRCSYKFCSYKDACLYNYNNITKNQCYQDHYVHNMVSADLNILIKYFEQHFKDNNFVIYNKEILKTINTLSFVINHMENELKSKCMYLNVHECESCHVIKIITI